MLSWDDKKSCPVCSYWGNLGPSDHEPWCSAFMVGAVDLEGEQELPFEPGAVSRAALYAEAEADELERDSYPEVEA